MKKYVYRILILTVVICVAQYVYKIATRAITDNKVISGGVRTRGVIIDQKNFMGNSPVSQAFSYSYEFSVNGKTYQNDSHDEHLKIGDSIDIVYVKEQPTLNKPIDK